MFNQIFVLFHKYQKFTNALFQLKKQTEHKWSFITKYILCQKTIIQIFLDLDSLGLFAQNLNPLKYWGIIQHRGGFVLLNLLRDEIWLSYFSSNSKGAFPLSLPDIALT